MRYGLVKRARGGRRRRAGRGRRYEAGVPDARAAGSVGRWRRQRRRHGGRGGGRGGSGRQRELQGQPDRVIERVRVQHAGFLAVRHGRTDGGSDADGVGAAGAAGRDENDPNGRKPLAVQRPCTQRGRQSWPFDACRARSLRLGSGDVLTRGYWFRADETRVPAERHNNIINRQYPFPHGPLVARAFVQIRVSVLYLFSMVFSFHVNTDTIGLVSSRGWTRRIYVCVCVFIYVRRSFFSLVRYLYDKPVRVIHSLHASGRRRA